MKSAYVYTHQVHKFVVRAATDIEATAYEEKNKMKQIKVKSTQTEKSGKGVTDSV